MQHALSSQELGMDQHPTQSLFQSKITELSLTGERMVSSISMFHSSVPTPLIIFTKMNDKILHCERPNFYFSNTPEGSS